MGSAGLVSGLRNISCDRSHLECRSALNRHPSVELILGFILIGLQGRDIVRGSGATGGLGNRCWLVWDSDDGCN